MMGGRQINKIHLWKCGNMMLENMIFRGEIWSFELEKLVFR